MKPNRVSDYFIAIDANLSSDKNIGKTEVYETETKIYDRAFFAKA